MSKHQLRDSPAEAVAMGRENSSSARLTEKEKQALLWSFRGKTSWEIARIQNCSESTINFHFSNILRKFAVSSRSAALIKAIESGVIAVGTLRPRGAHEYD